MLALSAANAGARAVPARQQNECAAVNPNKGEGKFTGQITGVNNSLIQIASGNETAVVHYDAGGVQVCEGGVAAPTNRLQPGASITVYGPMKRKGKGLEMTATKIVIAGPPPGLKMGNASAADQGGMRPINSSVANSAVAYGGAKTGTAATDAWQNPGPATTEGSGGANSVASSGGAGTPQGKQNSNAARIDCLALKFSASSQRSATGMAAGRTSISGVTCKMSVNQMAMELMQDALTARRLPSVMLSFQNELEVSLSDAEVSEVLFTWENGVEVVEATFSAQRIEVTHRPSGTHASLGEGAIR